MKKLVLASLILILVPALIFVPLFSLMVYTANNSVQDYSEDILGQWEAIQYYSGKNRFVCDEENYIVMTIEESKIVVDSTVINSDTYDYSWRGNNRIELLLNNQSAVYHISFESNGNLKIVIGNNEFIILLRKVEG